MTITLSDLVEMPVKKEQRQQGDSLANWLIELRRYYEIEGYNEALSEIRSLKVSEEKLLAVVGVNIQNAITEFIMNVDNVFLSPAKRPELSAAIYANIKDVLVFKDKDSL